MGHGFKAADCAAGDAAMVVTMSDIWRQLQREAKANGKKAGLLAVLFLVGCCFWIPMLVRAVKPPRSVTKSAASIPQLAPDAVNSAGETAAAAATDAGAFWSTLAASLADDPMFQSVDPAELARDPFQGAEVPEPLPALIVEETRPPEETRPEPETQKLALNSTIIGRSRRAALINGKLYHLGRRIQANGRNYQLTNIESHRVVLSSTEDTIELTLARPQLKDVLDRVNDIGPDLPE